MWLISLAISPISDYLINRNFISPRTGRKLFNTLGHWIPAIALVILPYAADRVVAIFLLTIAVGLNGCTYVGYMVNHMDLSPNFAGPLMGLTNTIANIMSVLGPLTVGYILTDDEDPTVCIPHAYFRIIFCTRATLSVPLWNWAFSIHSRFYAVTTTNNRITGQNWRMEISIFHSSWLLLHWQFALHHTRQGGNTAMEWCKQIEYIGSKWKRNQ